MYIYTRDFIGIVVSVLLLFDQILPLVTCQQELESKDGVFKFSVQSVIGVILISMFLISMVACCLFYASRRAEIEATGREVLHVRANRGLDKEVIESFPCFLYLDVKGHKIGKGGVECAICLNEFKNEEMLRWMPPCSHTFHTNCIDMWLSSWSTCPICRANLSMQLGKSFPFPNMDLESGIEQRDDLESISLTENNGNYIGPRSKSTGVLSSWRMTDIFVPRSHSTGHSLVQLGENLDRFTLQLPEEVQRQLVSLNQIRRNHMALPRAMSSRQGYRSGSFGSQKGKGRRSLRRAISMSLIFSVHSTTGKDNVVGETSQSKDKDFGERSFQRLMPEKV